MSPEIQVAIEEICQAFPGKTVEVRDDGEGGAFVVVRDLEIGSQYNPASSWVGFRITFQYPHGDIYPHYINGNVVRVDGQGHRNGFNLNQSFLGLPGYPAIMLSRRSNRWNAGQDTAALKLAKVLEWLRMQ